jgi:hypothetical protein
MSAIEDYKIDFIKRTKEILEGGYKDFEEKDREVTFLLNCLLGLVVGVSENEKRENRIFQGNIDDSFLKLIPEKIGFIEKSQYKNDLTNKDLTTLDLLVRHKNDLKMKKKLWFINKIRNCIAHQNISGVNENGQWIGVRLWNENSSMKDFEIILTVEETKNLAIALANEYLKNT